MIQGNVDRASAEEIVDAVISSLEGWDTVEKQDAANRIENAIIGVQGVWVTLR